MIRKSRDFDKPNSVFGYTGVLSSEVRDCFCSEEDEGMGEGEKETSEDSEEGRVSSVYVPFSRYLSITYESNNES